MDRLEPAAGTGLGEFLLPQDFLFSLLFRETSARWKPPSAAPLHNRLLSALPAFCWELLLAVQQLWFLSQHRRCSRTLAVLLYRALTQELPPRPPFLYRDPGELRANNEVYGASAEPQPSAPTGASVASAVLLPPAQGHVCLGKEPPASECGSGLAGPALPSSRTLGFPS